MSRNNLITKGGLYIVFYVFTSALANVFINHSTRSIAPIVTLFYNSVITIVFFTILNLDTLTQNSSLVKKNIKPILWLNILNAIMWFVIFFSLKVLSPSVFACILFGAIPISLFLLQVKGSTVSNQNNRITAFLLLILFILMLLLVSQDMTTTNSSQIILYGTLVAIIGGLIGAYIMKISKKLATQNLSASLVIALRFYGLLIISLLLIIPNPTQLLVAPTVLAEIFTLAIVAMALPLFLLQKALKNLNPFYASIIITAIPITTYVLQLLTGYYSFSIKNLGIIALFSLTLITLTYIKNREQ